MAKKPKRLEAFTPATAATPRGHLCNTTGGSVVVFRGQSWLASYDQLAKVAGVRKDRIVTTADFDDGAIDLAQAADASAIMFPRLGVAVVQHELAQPGTKLLEMARPNGPIESVVPERFYALADDVQASAALSVSPDYLRGGIDALTHLYRELTGERVASLAEALVRSASLLKRIEDDPTRTWGLAATGVSACGATGLGARIAVLDTGFDLSHPDFAGREVIAQSFVAGEGPRDLHGHGTHCAGTACGGADRAGRRYGVARDATLLVGKIFPAGGFATDTNILAGIDWALTQKCQVVSMSFETPVRPGQGFNTAYDRIGARALDAGTVLVAAAGNQSNRPLLINPVSSPADSPSILSVAALDPFLQVAAFSNGAINLDGGKVDVAAPGVFVWSSLPAPGNNGFLSGTSQATPHVAGILALWWQASGGKTGRELWSLVARATAEYNHAQPLGLPIRDIGFGLIRAPR